MQLFALTLFNALREPVFLPQLTRSTAKHENTPFFQPSDRPTLHKHRSELEELARSPGNDDERKQTEEGKLHT